MRQRRRPPLSLLHLRQTTAATTSSTSFGYRFINHHHIDHLLRFPLASICGRAPPPQISPLLPPFLAARASWLATPSSSELGSSPKGTRPAWAPSTSPASRDPRSTATGMGPTPPRRPAALPSPARASWATRMGLLAGCRRARGSPCTKCAGLVGASAPMTPAPPHLVTSVGHPTSASSPQWATPPRPRLLRGPPQLNPFLGPPPSSILGSGPDQRDSLFGFTSSLVQLRPTTGGGGGKGRRLEEEHEEERGVAGGGARGGERGGRRSHAREESVGSQLQKRRRRRRRTGRDLGVGN